MLAITSCLSKTESHNLYKQIVKALEEVLTRQSRESRATYPASIV